MNEFEAPTGPEIDLADADMVVTIEYGGESYRLPASLDDADGDVLEAIEDQKLSRALQALMGPQDWKRFKKTRPKIRDYGGLFDAYAKRIGLDSTGD